MVDISAYVHPAIVGAVVDGAFVGDDVVGTVVGAVLGAEVGAEVGGVGAEVGAEVGAAVGVDVVKESAAAAPLASFKVFVHSMIETWGFAATSQFTDHAVPAAAQTIVVSVPNAAGARPDAGGAAALATATAAVARRSSPKRRHISLS